jgi:hypothetical protein
VPPEQYSNVLPSHWRVPSVHGPASVPLLLRRFGPHAAATITMTMHHARDGRMLLTSAASLYQDARATSYGRVVACSLQRFDRAVAS